MIKISIILFFVLNLQIIWNYSKQIIVLMTQILIISVVVLLLCMAFLSINILLRKNGRFPNTHVSSNRELRRRGINCIQSQDFEMRHRRPGIKEHVKQS